MPELKEEILKLIIKDYWMNEILQGRKTIEYRDVKPFYNSRIEGKNITMCIFQVGYSKNAKKYSIPIEKIVILQGQYNIHLKINKNG